MEMEEKEKVKAFFGFTQVPFCVVVNPSGVVIAAGDPKGMDLEKLLTLCDPIAENIVNNTKPSVIKTTSQPVFALDEDF
jgi:hypothetical protein